MSSNVGLTTPRGSGTSGYVQRNLSNLRPRDAIAPYPKDFSHPSHRQRQPDQSILDHDRKRNVELKCFEERDRLEDEGVPEDEIEERVSKMRATLLAALNSGAVGKNSVNGRGLKSHQVHDLAAAKIAENDRFGKALGISKDYEEGSHWRRQEEEKKKREEEVVAREAEAARERERKGREEEGETRRRERSVSSSRSDSRSRSRSGSRSRDSRR